MESFALTPITRPHHSCDFWQFSRPSSSGIRYNYMTNFYPIPLVSILMVGKTVTGRKVKSAKVIPVSDFLKSPRRPFLFN